MYNKLIKNRKKRINFGRLTDKRKKIKKFCKKLYKTT